MIETEAPLGYNKLTAPVDVNINVAKTNEPADDSGDELDFDAGTFYVSATVENNTGSELPGTGGIGTTIFYVLGGGLMLAAVVLLVVKKRMSVE